MKGARGHVIIGAFNEPKYKLEKEERESMRSTEDLRCERWKSLPPPTNLDAGCKFVRAEGGRRRGGGAAGRRSKAARFKAVTFLLMTDMLMERTEGRKGKAGGGGGAASDLVADDRNPCVGCPSEVVHAWVLELHAC